LSNKNKIGPGHFSGFNIQALSFVSPGFLDNSVAVFDTYVETL